LGGPGIYMPFLQIEQIEEPAMVTIVDGSQHEQVETGGMLLLD
jgi:hypothetical protein